MRAQLPNSPRGFDEQEAKAFSLLIGFFMLILAGLFALKVYDQGWPW